MTFKETTEGLNKCVEAVRRMGGEKEIEKQHARNKLTVRERIELLCDKGSFQELGTLTHHTSQHPDLKDRQTPADGVVCGTALIDGRPVSLIGYDFTVLAGSMGKNGEEKVERMREMSLERKIPIIWLLDSAGARVQEMAGAQFAATGKLFKDQVDLSGNVPQIAAIMGPTAAGTSYIAGLSDFVPMVKGIGTMALAGPALVKAAIGEDIDIEKLGGSRVHTELSGVGTLECENDQECLTSIRKFLSYLPSNFSSSLPVLEVKPKRLSDDIFQIIPDSKKRAYSMHKLIHWLADADSVFELHPKWAKNMVTAFVRIGGLPVGIVANQPEVLGGAIDIDAADKATRLINLCDAFGVPLLFVHDCPGFMVGSKVESAGIIRHGAKMLYAVSRATTPKISLVVRKSYGAGYYVMCGKGYDPDLIVAWPGAEISLMSPEGAASILGMGDDPAKVEAFRNVIGVEMSARSGWIDDVIDPRETSILLSHHLKPLVAKHDRERFLRAEKKHGVSPV